MIKHRQHEVSFRYYLRWSLYVNLHISVLWHVKYTVYISVDYTSKNVDILDFNRKFKCWNRIFERIFFELGAGIAHSVEKLCFSLESDE